MSASSVEEIRRLRQRVEEVEGALDELHAAAGGALRVMYNDWHSAPKRDMVDEYEDLKEASRRARQVLDTGESE